MKIRFPRFNTYLIAALCALGAGCKTTAEKEVSTLQFHLEVTPDGTEHNSLVPIGREGTFTVNVEKAAFLNEGLVAKAAVVNDALGSFALMIQFNRKGSWMLEQYTVAHKGRRVAILSQFGEARWLAAPKMNNRITDGLFVFTPDATREEAERIARGLNNVAKELGNKEKE